MNHNYHLNGEETISNDEAWWASLLADEERHGGNGDLRANMESFSEHKENIMPLHQPAVDWPVVQHLYDADETLELSIVGYNRGGLLAEGKGIHGFIPISHLVDVVCDLPEEARDDVLADYVGQKLLLKVIECDQGRGRIVFSERAAQASTGRRNQLLLELKPGECVSGVVTNITEFGVFVDLGGVEGLIHVSELSWGRVRYPGDIVKIGDRVTAYVIHVDRDRTRIALSLKRMCSNPWQTAEQRYHAGQIVEAVITGLATYGAFARLEEGVDGLIHVSEMGLEPGMEMEAYYSEGQTVQARIIHIDAARQRLGLSLQVEQVHS